MRIKADIAIIADCCVVGWLESVGSWVVYELDYKKVEETYPVRCSHLEYPGQASCDTCWWHCNYSAPHEQHLSGRSRVVPATAGRARAMDAGFGSSTRGHWDGPVTCNKSHGIAAREATGRKIPYEHGALPCLGHATRQLPPALAVLWQFYLVLSAVHDCASAR